MIVVPFLTLSHVRRHRCCWQERQQTRTWPDMSHSQIPPCRSIMDLPRPDASLRWSSPWALTLGDSRTCDESARITIVYVPANQRRSTLCHNITACGHFHMQWYYDIMISDKASRHVMRTHAEIFIGIVGRIEPQHHTSQPSNPANASMQLLSSAHLICLHPMCRPPASTDTFTSWRLNFWNAVTA